MTSVKPSLAVRIAAFVMLGAAALLGGAALWLSISRPETVTSAPLAAFTVAGEVGGPWSLIDHDGARVRDADFAGQHLLVFFGFTYCPDVCPVGLANLAAALDALGPLGEKVTPLFVTIDPERDTPAKLKSYVASFHPRLRGLTGNAEEIKAAAAAFKVFYRKEGEGADYLMQHSSFTYFIGPDGKSRSIFRHGAAPADMAATMRKLLS